MSDIVSPLLQWLNANPELAGLVTFTISAAESVAIIGTIVPGTIMMTALGALAGAGVIPLWSTIFWAILGAIVGDGISYWIGFYFKDRLPSVWPFRTHPALLTTGEKFFLKYGSMSVLLGRFVGPVRALVPLVAGMLGMRPLQFTIANVISAIGWAPLYMLPGILLGAASLELPPDIAIHVMLVLLLITLFFLLCLWFIYKLMLLISKQTDQAQTKIWGYLQKTPQLRFTTTLLRHHDPAAPHGQLNLFFYFLFTVVLFAGLVFYIKLNGAPNIGVNEAILHLFRGLRNNLNIDNIMINISLLGQKEVILPVVLIIFGLLVYWRRWSAAFHALALGVLAAGSIFVIKNLVRSPRPWGIFRSPESFSLPSGHTTLSTCVFLGLAFLLAKSCRESRRWIIYTVSLIIIFAVGVSRMYLGAHWFTDVISGWLLSAAVVMLVILSYERNKEQLLPVANILIVSLLSLFVTFNVYHYARFEQMKVSYTQINWPSLDIALNEWWQKNDMLPAYRSSLFGFPSQKINLAWAGDLEKIKETLTQEGWTKPPARDWISTLHRLADVKSTQYLPLISPQYLDQKPTLILAKHSQDGKNLYVLRLWDSNRRIKENSNILWVGTIEMVPRSYSWIYKKRPGEIEIDPMLIFTNTANDQAWEWKIMSMHLSTGTKQIIRQKIMLIKPTIGASNGTSVN